MKYSDTELAALISEVEKEFTDHLNKAEAEQEHKITKSEDVDVQASQEEVVEKTEEFDYSNEDVQEMDGLYASMSKSEKEAHYQSVKKALFGNEKELGQMEKSEKVVVKKEESDLMKSANEALKTQLEKAEKDNEELKKSFSDLIKKLNGFVGKSAPKQKAITKIEYVAKSEDVVENKKEDEVDVTKLTKSEISTRLNEKIRNGVIKKSERELINAFYLEGKSIETIKHLL